MATSARDDVCLLLAFPYFAPSVDCLAGRANAAKIQQPASSTLPLPALLDQDRHRVSVSVYQ